MQITIVPASTRVSAATIRFLLSSASPPTIVAYYRNLSRVPPEFLNNPNFTARQGDVEDPSSLDFSGSDAVLSITPMWHDGRDVVEVAKEVSQNVKNKIEETGSNVKRLVIVSSLGGQYAEGTGAIQTNHAAEQILGKTTVPEVVIVRPVYFMENWSTAVETVKSEGFFYSTFTPSTLKIPHIAIKDIGQTLSTQLLSTGSGSPLPGPSPYPFEIHGPMHSVEDVKKAFEEISGKEVEVRVIPPEGVEGFYSAVFPLGTVAKYYADMNDSILEGGKLFEDPEPTLDKRQVGETGLKEVLEGLWNLEVGGDN